MKVLHAIVFGAIPEQTTKILEAINKMNLGYSHII